MSGPAETAKVRRRLWDRLKDKSFAEQMLADERLREQEREERAEILALLPSFAGGAVVDLGAGVGRFTAEFAPSAKHVLAVDLLDHALTKNRERNREARNIEYRCADALELEVPAGTVDLVFSNWLLMYLSDDEVRRFLERARQWLAPGGHLFVKESCETNVVGYGPLRIALTGLFQKYTGIVINRHVATAPTWGEIWRWLTRRKTGQSIYYRRAAEYDAFFANGYEVVRRGHLRVFERAYGHRNQRYWLVAPRD